MGDNRCDPAVALFQLWFDATVLWLKEKENVNFLLHVSALAEELEEPELTEVLFYFR